MRHLFLLDIDSVLVEARGYLLALQDTVALFSQWMGLPEFPPTEGEVRAFEANGLSSEWDSGAACVAALLLARLRQQNLACIPDSWAALLAALSAQPGSVPRPDYAALAQRAGLLAQKGRIAPTEAMREIVAQEAGTLPLPAHQRPALNRILDALVGHTHDFTAPVTRVFQHLAIGSQNIPATYGVAADLESDAYLARFDRPLLSPDCRDRLLAFAGRGVGLALYTARPSLPPPGADEPAIGYSPEAEMARELVGLEAAPLIALGRLRWLAERTGERSENLVKPSPVQALAAVGAAFSGQEAASLCAALALHLSGELSAPLSEVDGTVLHVFEDTPGGLQAVERTVHVLTFHGLRVSWKGYGIVPGTGAKAEAMRALGVPAFASINDALGAAFHEIAP